MTTLPRLDVLIKEARAYSLNSDYDDDSGIPQSFFVQAAQNANVSLNRIIVKEVSEAFASYYEFDLVADDQDYDLPTMLFAENMVYLAEYSATGLAQDYLELERRQDRQYDIIGSPQEYAIDNGVIYILPTPTSSSGKVRLRYEKRKDNVALRSGKVASTTGALPSLTAITLEDEAIWLDSDALGGAIEYVCINNASGTILMRNVPIDSYDSTTRTLTVSSGFASGSGETIPVGSYVTIGADTTTHPQYYPFCRDYFITYMQVAAMNIRGSTDEIEEDERLKGIRTEIIDIYQQMPTGKVFIPERRMF